MKNLRIAVLGGTGFIGTHIVNRLVESGHRVVVPSRRAAVARQLMPLPTVELTQTNIHDPRQLQALLHGCDAVINCVGILHSHHGDPYGPEFARVHVDLPREIARAMHANGVQRLIHLSALGASSGAPSMYLRSKADGEAALKAEASLQLTVFQPSVVFGPEDQFLNLFAALAKWLPFVPIGAAQAQFQPVFVHDLAQAVVNVLVNPQTYQRTYLLCGPKVYTLAELVRFAAQVSGHPRWVMPLPAPLAWLQAYVLEHMPGGPLMSRDNLASMKLPSIAPAGWQVAAELGLAYLTPLEQQAPIYLGLLSADSQYDRFRTHAGR